MPGHYGKKKGKGKGKAASTAKGGNRYSKGNKNRPLPMKTNGRRSSKR